jgi:hypothetical protein
LVINTGTTIITFLTVFLILPFRLGHRRQRRFELDRRVLFAASPLSSCAIVSQAFCQWARCTPPAFLRSTRYNRRANECGPQAHPGANHDSGSCRCRCVAPGREKTQSAPRLFRNRSERLQGAMQYLAKLTGQGADA